MNKPQNPNDPPLLTLFFAFFKVGLFTLGGGYAMLPMLERELINKLGVICSKTLHDYYALSQSTPGAIGLNCASLIGYKVRKFWGAFIAISGVILPSWIIMIILAGFFKHFAQNPWVQKAFTGIRVAVLALIINILIRMIHRSIKNVEAFLILALSFVAILFFKISPVYIILTCGVLGILLQFFLSRSKTAKGDH